MVFINLPNLCLIEDVLIVDFDEENENEIENHYSIILNETEKDDYCLVCSAVYFKEGEHIVAGKRHGECLQYRNKLFEGIYQKRICENDEDVFGGFIAYNLRTHEIKFVTRKEGLLIIKNNIQQLRDENITDILYSENLF